MKKYFISFRMIISFILVILIFEANGIFSLATTSTLYIPNHHVPAYVYLCDSYELKSDASIETEGITILESGQLVFITEIVEDKEEFWWCKVEVKSEELTLVGYIQREYLVTADQEFLEWERQRAPLSSLLNDDNDVDINYSLDVLEFPESYRESLQALKNQYPNWTFVKKDTKLKWSNVVAAQMKADTSLIHSSYPEHMKNGYYGGGFYYTTTESLEYFLDPRSWLTINGVFQFEQLTFPEAIYNSSIIQTFLDNKFMKGLVPGHTKTYAETFYDIGTRLKVSPLHLACRVYQEQGTGESPLISGTYAPYEGYYNYFNIGASGSTNEAIYNSGLKKAQQYGWSTHLRSLEGGAEVLSSNYILRGQDTLYLQKFDVDDKYDGLYWHQYMQNISAPSNEGKNIKNIYEQAGLLDINRIFIIPVFQEMPQVASPYPSISYHISFEVDESYTGNIIYLDGVKKEVTREGNRISFTADNDKATTVTMYRYNENNVPIGMRVWSLEFGKTKYEITLLPQFEDLLSYHGFSIRITGNPGMRFKAGISEKIKKDLVQSNINGFTLKEYGGILMKESRASAYPLIYDGQYTLKGVAYGTVNGSFTDKVYETIAGRNRFTTVLVGMAPNAYKENLIFRGYCILMKNGKEYIIYGPPVGRNLYQLAEQVLSLGTYEDGSPQKEYLEKVISDADAIGKTFH